MIKYRVYTEIGYDEFAEANYDLAVKHYTEKGIGEIETIEYEIPSETES